MSKKILLLLILASASFNTQAGLKDTLKGRVALSFENAFLTVPTSAHSRHIINMALSQKIFSELQKVNNSSSYAYVVWNLQEFVMSYRVVTMNQIGSVIHYTLEVTWGPRWEELLKRKKPTTLTQEDNAMRYFVHVDPKLLTALQTPLLPFLKRIESLILNEGLKLGAMSDQAFVPAVRLDKMAQAQVSEPKNLCQNEDKGVLWIDFQHRSPETFKKRIRYVPCSPKSLHATGIESLQSNSVFSDSKAKPWLVPAMAMTLASLSPAKVLGKNLHVQFQWGLNYANYQKLDRTLKKLSKRLGYIQDVELFRLTSLGPNYTFTTSHLGPDNKRELAQELINFCNSHGMRCHIFYGMYQSSELWQLVGTRI